MPEDVSLDSIGLKHGTDKASPHHNYLNFYEPFFLPMRYRNMTVLEIGIFNGASLKTWEEYFPNSRIIGADINPATKRSERGRVTVEILDQSNIEELAQLALSHGPFDIIIEDGSHICEHQITSLRTLFPFLKNGGIYIVEDLQTNYGFMLAGHRGNTSKTCVEFLKEWLDLKVADTMLDLTKLEDAFLRTYGRSVSFMTFYRRACLITKDYIKLERLRSVGDPIVTVPPQVAAVEVYIIAHLSGMGDIFSSSGFVNLGPKYTFQGFSMSTGQSLLEYRVRLMDGSWGDWTFEDGFAGTKQKSTLLTGVAVRLREEVKQDYALHLAALFVDEPGPAEVTDGEICLSATDNPLCGIRVNVKKLSKTFKSS